MKKTFLLLWVSLCTFFTISAQDLKSSTLWKIDGKGLEQASYLFGTIHLTCDASLDDKIIIALEETDQLVMELDMDDPEMQMQMMEQMFMKNGEKVSRLISEDDYELLDEFLSKELGMGLASIEQMKPFFIQASLFPKLLNCPMQSYELELMKATKTQNEEIYGLESLQEQMKVFDDIPYEDQLKDLIQMAKDNMEHSKQMMTTMMELYDDENIQALLELINDDRYSAMSEHQDLLLSERNKKWIHKIESFAKDKPTFFGVGAGHLAGENGVITLLRKKGYRVTAVR
jgi:uncharacterized protein YbaP (TraB family)